MKTILISNRKGGSAKTTTAVNLAAQLSLSHSVLLIDFDTQGHASIGFDVTCFDYIGSHGIFKGKSLSESFMPTCVENLTISPAMQMFDISEFNSSNTLLKDIFIKENLSMFFDFCVIDTPPTYDAILKNSLEVADVVIIPVITQPLGIVGALQMFRAIYKSKTESSNISLVGVLPVMYNPHIKEHKESLEKLKSQIGEDKIFYPIGIDIALSKQFELKEPVIFWKKRSKGAEDYRDFVEELLKRMKFDDQS